VPWQRTQSKVSDAAFGKQLFVTFITGDTRVYDCAPLLNESVFYPLKDDAFFKNVHVDKTGYGIVWNDNVDLSESELWVNGKITAPNERLDQNTR